MKRSWKVRASIFSQWIPSSLCKECIESPCNVYRVDRPQNARKQWGFDHSNKQYLVLFLHCSTKYIVHLFIFLSIASTEIFMNVYKIGFSLKSIIFVIKIICLQCLETTRVAVKSKESNNLSPFRMHPRPVNKSPISCLLWKIMIILAYLIYNCRMYFCCMTVCFKLNMKKKL